MEKPDAPFTLSFARRSKLTKADLRGSGLREAMLELAHLRRETHANLQEADFTQVLVAIPLEGEILCSRSFWQRKQELSHLRGTIQLGPMPLLRQEREL